MQKFSREQINDLFPKKKTKPEISDQVLDNINGEDFWLYYMWYDGKSDVYRVITDIVGRPVGFVCKRLPNSGGARKGMCNVALKEDKLINIAQLTAEPFHPKKGAYQPLIPITMHESPVWLHDRLAEYYGYSGLRDVTQLLALPESNHLERQWLLASSYKHILTLYDFVWNVTQRQW
jgi:hypothetical protein